MKNIWTVLTGVVLCMLALGSLSAQTLDDYDLEEDAGTPGLSPNDFDGGEPVYNRTPPPAEADTETLPPEAQGLEKYVVQSGDTLWDICGRLLNSPWYWQKVWAMNPHIANPHWIYPGNVIYFSNAGMMGAMVSMEEQTKAEDLSAIPEIMDEQEWGDVAEGGKYRLEQYLTNIQATTYNFHNFRRDGFLARNELRYSGKIVNSPKDAIYLTTFDMAYIKPEDINTFSIGQKYQIFKNKGEIEHPVTGDSVGYKVRIIGQCVVKRITNKVVTVQITESFGEIERGALVRPWKNPVKDIRPRRNKVNMRGYIVEKLEDSLVFNSENQIVFLDKGISQGIEEGNRVFAVRQLKPMDVKGSIDRDDLPFEKIGELIVLSAGSKTSVAMISRSLLDIKLGDEFVMEKNY